MTWLSKLLSVFPAGVGVGAIAALLGLVQSDGGYQSLLWLSGFLFVLYGLPLLCFRLHHWRYPLCEGITYLQGEDYSPWWGAHQLQLIYIVLPSLEVPLRLVPGLYAAWLRLWGSEIGQQVYWAPGVEVADRSLLSIGDRVVLGNQVGLYAHIIKPKRQNLMLYVKRIRIGNDSFVGAWSKLGPGSQIAAGSQLMIGSYYYPNARQASSQKEGALER